MDVKIRRPFNLRIDEALEHGKVDMPAVPDGLYLRRMARELDGAIEVERMRHGLFRATRTDEIMEKINESNKYATYRRTTKKWLDLL